METTTPLDGLVDVAPSAHLASRESFTKALVALLSPTLDVGETIRRVVQQQQSLNREIDELNHKIALCLVQSTSHQQEIELYVAKLKAARTRVDALNKLFVSIKSRMVKLHERIVLKTKAIETSNDQLRDSLTGPSKQSAVVEAEPQTTAEGAQEDAGRAAGAEAAISKEQESLESDRQVREQETMETDRKAKGEAEQKTKEEADRKAKEEAEQEAKEEADRRAKEEADRQAKEEADRLAAAVAAQEEAARRAIEDAEQQALEAAEQNDGENNLDASALPPQAATEAATSAVQEESVPTSVSPAAPAADDEPATAAADNAHAPANKKGGKSGGKKKGGK